MIKLLSVNIEGKKHLDKILGLITKINPDVICMQEVFFDDIEKFTDLYPGEYLFSPIILKTYDAVDSSGDLIEFGNLILSRLPVIEKTEDYYVSSRDKLNAHRSGFHEGIAMVLSSFTLEKDNETFKVATTHFCKSETGDVVSEFQRNSIDKLLNSMNKLGDFVVCGDFNAPRGREIFSLIAEKYKDNIDKKYLHSLDPDLHRAGYLPYMVDGLFSTEKYKVSNMYFETGVSDHYAIVADINV